MNKFQKVFVTSLTMLFLGTSPSNALEILPDEGDPTEASGPLAFLRSAWACNVGEIVRYNLREKYNETPIAMGSFTHNVLDNENRLIQKIGDVYIYVNLKTEDFTIMVDYPKEGLSCVVGSGERFGPYIEGVKTKYEH